MSSSDHTLLLAGFNAFVYIISTESLLCMFYYINSNISDLQHREAVIMIEKLLLAQSILSLLVWGEPACLYI